MKKKMTKMARGFVVLLSVMVCFGVLLGLPSGALEAAEGESSTVEAGNSTTDSVSFEENSLDSTDDFSEPDSDLVQEDSSFVDVEEEGEELLVSARGAAPMADVSAMVDVGAYLGTLENGRYPLDLKDLKDANILAATLVIEGGADTFVSIVDTGDGSVNGEYNILLGENGGVELTAGLEAKGNTFYSIANKTGIGTILPIYLHSSVGSVSLQNGGAPLQIKSTVGGDVYGNKMAVVASGAGVVVESMAFADVQVNYADNAVYETPPLFGAYYGATINTMSLNGNITISYTTYKIGPMFGAAKEGTVGSLTVSGSLTINGSIPRNINDGYKVLVGNYYGTMGELVFEQDAVVNINSAGASSNGCAIGAVGTKSAVGAQIDNLVAKPGSKIIIQNAKNADSAAMIGNRVMNYDLAGEIVIAGTGAAGVFIGNYYFRDSGKMLLVRSTANIDVRTDNYFAAAIGVNGAYADAGIYNIVIERGARINAETTKPVFSPDYPYANIVVGALSPSATAAGLHKLLVGAVYDTASGGYVVPDTVDPANQTVITSKNLSALLSSPMNAVSLNASAYAVVETYASAPKYRDFYGAKNGKITMLGGSYLVENRIEGTIKQMEFTNYYKYTSTQMNSSNAYNVYGELLASLLYEDAASGETFTYNVAGAHLWRGAGQQEYSFTQAEYDYISSRNGVPGVDAKYKSIYYPKRYLYETMEAPAYGESVPVNGQLKLRFDQPVYAEDNVDVGMQFKLTQGDKIFMVNFSTADSAKYTFGSSVPGDDPRYVYINLAELVSTEGTPLEAGVPVKLDYGDYVNGKRTLMRTILYSEDSQLSLERLCDTIATTFNVVPATHTVQFNLNGGTSAAIANQTVAKGSFVSQPQNPSRANHTFLGWYTQASGGSQWNFAVDTVVSDMVLYARWKADVVSSPVTPPASTAPSSSSQGPASSSGVSSQSSSSPLSGGINVNSGSGSSSSAAPAASSGQGGGTTSGGTSGGVDARLSGQTGNLVTDIINGSVPLASFSGGTWGLLNLILSVVAAIMAVVLTVRGFVKRKAAEEMESEAVTPKNRWSLSRVFAVVGGLMPGLLFLVLDNMKQPVTFVNHNTLVIALVFVLFIALVLVQTFHERKKRDGGDEEYDEQELYVHS